MRLGDIEIDPFDPAMLNPASYDVTLGPLLRTYDREAGHLDPLADNPTFEWFIPAGGTVLRPGVLYLASTAERTWCRDLVPCLHGKSSLARLGLLIHQTAGYGDPSWRGQWTCELTCTHPVVVRPGMRIGQINFQETLGRTVAYAGRYQDQSGPTASRYHLGHG